LEETEEVDLVFQGQVAHLIQEEFFYQGVGIDSANQYAYWGLLTGALLL
jgi:hypothetical protein